MSIHGGYCSYCGFLLVCDGPRECCRAGREYDALGFRLWAYQMAEAMAMDHIKKLRRSRDDWYGKAKTLESQSAKGVAK
jgi:hypothetical protein